MKYNLIVVESITMQMTSVRQILLPGIIENCLLSIVLLGLPHLKVKKNYMLHLMNSKKDHK